MKIGPNHFCDECGVEIQSGTHCNECNPATGSEQVSAILIGVERKPGILDRLVKRTKGGK